MKIIQTLIQENKLTELQYKEQGARFKCQFKHIDICINKLNVTNYDNTLLTLLL